MLILKGLKRLLEEKGVLPKSKNANYDVLDKYEYSAQSIKKNQGKTD